MISIFGITIVLYVGCILLVFRRLLLDDKAEKKFLFSLLLFYQLVVLCLCICAHAMLMLTSLHFVVLSFLFRLCF